VEREELVATDVPVQTTEVGVVYLEVSQQLVESFDYGSYGSGIKAGDFESFHKSDCFEGLMYYCFLLVFWCKDTAHFAPRQQIETNTR
jgi:hypothetical protein